MPATIAVDGRDYPVAHAFGDARAIIDMDGVYVFVDRNPDGTWDLSGVPTRPAEKATLDELIAPTLDATAVKVTPPET